MLPLAPSLAAREFGQNDEQLVGRQRQMSGGQGGGCADDCGLE
jgi:hypothetical protein